MPPYVRYAAMILAVASVSAAAYAGARFPRLNAAEGNLNVALRELEAAPGIFHGHKQNAENLIRQAIAEIQRGKMTVR
jgi:hypothetical protein